MLPYYRGASLLTEIYGLDRCYAIIAIIGFFRLVSLIRGFVREALSLITCCGFFVASQF